MLFSQQVFLVAGLSRSGVSAAEFLLSRGAKVYAYDDAEGESVQKAIVSLSEQGCRIVHREELSERAKECDILVLSPGIPIDHPLARFFRTHGKRVTGEMELGALALACPAVAVTGTNGKTTTVTMLERIFRAAGKECFACGNSGFPLTSAAQKLKSGGVAAVEVSSFQLETLSSLRPHVAIVLNIAEDHLDRHYNMENYIYLKRKLLKNCTESEYAVLDRDDLVVRSFAEHTKAQTVWFSVKERVEGAYLEDDHLCFKGEKVLSTDDLSVRGEHNLANALAAVAAAKLMGVGNDAIASALSSFKGVSHRLEKVLEKDGVIYIDDSKATNVDSCLKAVAGLDRETVLLVGGKEKGEQFGPLFSALKRSRVVHAVLFGECAFRLMNAAMEENFTAVTLCRPFEVAVNVACLTARPGQNVLLSPAAASFDEFRSFEERGEKFASLVKAYAEPSASEAAAGDADGERGETGKEDRSLD